MNLALEYLLRNGQARKLLQFPCSLPLNHRETGRELLVTIREPFGGVFLNVQHWDLRKLSFGGLPRFTEYTVDRDDVFADKAIIVPNHDLLKFTENSFVTGGRQQSDNPHCVLQEVEYQSCFNSFLNPHIHRISRANWLWRIFYAHHIPGHLSWYAPTPDLERAIAQQYAKREWGYWKTWRKNLIDFDTSAASELVFCFDYKPPEKKIDNSYIYCSM